MKTRITKTLLESWAYMFDCYEGGEEEAYESFLKTLKREPLEETEAIANGKAFEAMVQALAEGREVHTGKWGNGARKIAEIVQGGQWQVHVDTDITVDGREYWLHGFCDVVKAGVIYDVKFKTKSFQSIDLWNAYKHSSQHSAYLRCLPEAYEFVYLISDGEDLYTEAYTRRNSVPIEDIVRNFMEWLKTEPELLKIYEERWIV
jgi:hypothetical protein